ncbi:MAG: radical SAM protein [Lachnospiraceae bacterium]|nr:radical SAM protein [Lachnospiraceae bacterium]
MKLLGNTQSVCPICLKVLPAVKEADETGVYLKKNCPKHGEFRTLIWEGSASSYTAWGRENLSAEQPVHPEKKGGDCPRQCGLCEEHQRKGCCMLLEVTGRCNLKCPVCFASAGSGSRREPTLEELDQQYDFLMQHGGPFNIQLSGGEPTLREDLPELIRRGRKKGFTFFQLNTNGMRLACEEGYAQSLKDAGLNTVFLQFDGTTEEVYRTLRGRALLDYKKQAIANCSEAGLGITLVPVIAPGVNDHQIGEILRFALSHMPYVRGVHFQPISYFGRCDQKRPDMPITIPRMLRLMEEQTEGALQISDFSGGGAENPYCSFHASYRVRDGKLKAMKKRSECCCCTTSDDSRTFVERQWSFDAASVIPGAGSSKQESAAALMQTDAFDEFLLELHRETFAVSGMIFQDAWNLDLDRLKRCYICEMDPEYGMVPFCAYNLTDQKGTYLYRK